MASGLGENYPPSAFWPTDVGLVFAPFFIERMWGMCNRQKHIDIIRDDFLNPALARHQYMLTGVSAADTVVVALHEAAQEPRSGAWYERLTTMVRKMGPPQFIAEEWDVLNQFLDTLIREYRDWHNANLERLKAEVG